MLKKSLTLIIVFFVSIVRSQDVTFKPLTDEPIDDILTRVIRLGEYGFISKFDGNKFGDIFYVNYYDFESKSLNVGLVSELNDLEKDWAEYELNSSIFIDNKLFAFSHKRPETGIQLVEYDRVTLKKTGFELFVELGENGKDFLLQSENEDYFMVTNWSNHNQVKKPEEKIVALVIDKKTLKVVTKCKVNVDSQYGRLDSNLTDQGEVIWVGCREVIKNNKPSDVLEVSVFKGQEAETFLYESTDLISNVHLLKDSNDRLTSILVYGGSEDMTEKIKLLVIQEGELELESEDQQSIIEIFEEDKTFFSLKTFKNPKGVSKMARIGSNYGFSSYEVMPNGDFIVQQQLQYQGAGGILKTLAVSRVSPTEGILWVKYLPVPDVLNTLVDREDNLHIFFNDETKRYDENSVFITYDDKKVLLYRFGAAHLVLSKEGEVIHRKLLFGKDYAFSAYSFTCENELIVWREAHLDREKKANEGRREVQVGILKVD